MPFGNRRPASYEAQMLAAADRLFAEFDALSVMAVTHAIALARQGLREEGWVATPEAVEASARVLLLRELAVR
jgi:hypothetical protein